jgi:hypothetical protein
MILFRSIRPGLPRGAGLVLAGLLWSGLGLPVLAQVPHPVPVTTLPITIDGVPDEAAWRDALVIPLAYETRPAENAPAPVRTECLIPYNTNHLYVAFRAFDPEPEKIRARLTDRDRAFNDDWVGVSLDTFNDERRAFEFFVNPLGVQMDLFYDDVNDNETSNWDAIWRSAGQLREDGYTVEMAVPFSSFRFPKEQTGPQTWGIDILRMWPRGSRFRFSNNPQDRARNCYLCQFEKIQGFENVNPGRNLQISPTLTTTRTDAREDGPQSPFLDGDQETDPGLTVRWGFTPSLNLSATVNPDFSQVEADVAQLDVNQRFALFFPEKRPFFLEGADFFDTPLDAVFTRNVADPTWGVKLSGKAGGHGIGAFVAKDEVTNLLFPGSQGSNSTSLDLENTTTVLRYRRDIGEGSSIGALVTNREGTNYENRVFGFDGLYQPTQSDRLEFQILGSRTRYPEAVARDFDQPIGAFDDLALGISYRHQERNWDAFIRHEDFGEDFRADMGFLPQVGRSFTLLGGGRTWWREGGGWFERLRLGTDVDSTRDEDGNELEREYEVFLEFDGPRQSFFFLGTGTRDRYFNGVQFDTEHFLNTHYRMQLNGTVRVALGAGFGDDIDFANTRPAEQLRLEPSVRFDLWRHLRAEVDHTYRRLEVDEGELFTANLTQLKLTYQLNLRMLARVILQRTAIDRDPTLFVDDVEASTERLLTQLLLSYKVNPQTVLFLGYTENGTGNQDFDLTRVNRTFFLKIGYAWVF